MSPRSALPEHIDEAHEWDGKDDDQHFFTKWRKKVKHLMAFGSRSPAGFTFCLFPPFIFTRKWRDLPICLFAKKGDGSFRWENVESWRPEQPEDKTPKGYEDYGYYLSRQQLWTRWHVQMQWPLFFAFHFYFKEKDVLKSGEHEDRDGRILFFYVGAKFDADRVYWYPAVYLGLNWK